MPDDRRFARGERRYVVAHPLRECPALLCFPLNPGNGADVFFRDVGRYATTHFIQAVSLCCAGRNTRRNHPTNRKRQQKGGPLRIARTRVHGEPGANCAPVHWVGSCRPPGWRPGDVDRLQSNGDANRVSIEPWRSLGSCLAAPSLSGRVWRTSSTPWRAAEQLTLTHERH